MTIQLNTDHNVKGSEAMNVKFSTIVSEGLSKLSTRITRVEIYLADENSHKHGVDDKRCTLEARLEGLQPIVVTHHAGNHEIAAKGAMDKLKSAIESTLGKMSHH